MTTENDGIYNDCDCVVEAYRLDRYDNPHTITITTAVNVVEAYRLDRYDNALMVTAIGVSGL